MSPVSEKASLFSPVQTRELTALLAVFATAVCGYGGAAEYVLAEESMVAPLPRRFQEGEHMLQAPVIAWNMARIFGESPRELFGSDSRSQRLTSDPRSSSQFRTSAVRRSTSAATSVSASTSAAATRRWASRARAAWPFMAKGESPTFSSFSFVKRAADLRSGRFSQRLCSPRARGPEGDERP